MKRNDQDKKMIKLACHKLEMVTICRFSNRITA
jgi:hypothetical protein